MQTLLPQVSLGLINFNSHLETLAFIVAALLFILALAGLSKQESAQRGNWFGVAGMAIALVSVLWIAISQDDKNAPLTAVLIIIALVIGAVVGLYKAKNVEMTGMPELIAMLHSFVGFAAVLVGYNSFLALPGENSPENAFHMGEVGLAVFIGAVTLTGSIIAYLKLSAKINGAPWMLPAHNIVNVVIILVSIGLMVWLGYSRGVSGGIAPLILITVLALVLGITLVMAIGGGDMPVVVSMLNSYSGWAAAMAGFTLGNDLLIITGALVGSSGAYLSYVMCQAMNRSFISVILGGFGDAPVSGEQKDYGEHTETTPAEVAELLSNASKVLITPGYGMAQANAQHAVASLTQKLRDKGVDVEFGIHPVAGRLPGHMNVLLAEANVPYDIVLEMDELEDVFPIEDCDVVLVIGANDTVNPAAEEEGSPISGMPVIKVWNAKKVIVFKRSMGNAGYAGVQNPLFFKENTDMLLGDAKKSVEDIAAAINDD
ncbi:MAG: NAD(P)(+) transhydrogenase (Re/Si-specific) subunit beta [Actinomycetaceae bacterium]|nr:NAD(P)(+) transhydrogenase (Re/Si-specific) subunit beta [Actinomycetaceae bacterium]MDY6083120.1 NAD(P)(+) transhydrogenase (Re/Si-specific) subunit beta [Actinomycetaceae bacterium]